MQCLNASRNGNKAHGCARRAVRSSIASSTGWFSVEISSPHTAPPAALPEVLKPKRIGYTLVMRKSSRSFTTCRRVNSTTAGVSPFSFVPSTACDLKSCGVSGLRTGKTGQNSGRFIRSRWAAPREPRRNPAGCTSCWYVMPMVLQLIGSSRRGCRWGRNCRH